jgi:CHAT domain-containing protein
MDWTTEVETVLALDDGEARRQQLARHVAGLCPAEQDQLAAILKNQADQYVRAEINRTFQVACLINDLAELTGNRRYQALSLLAQGNGHVIGLADYPQGLACYDAAIALYGQLGDPLRQAQSQTARLWALASLGRYDEALAAGHAAAAVLEAHGEWLALAKLTSNVAAIYGRLGQDAEALTLFERTRDAYRRLGPAGELPLLRVELNRAIVLRNLGRFQESIAANQAVLAAYQHSAVDQAAAIARAQQNLAVTYFVLGRYNEALALLDVARETFLADGQQRHAMLVELFTADCLLHLRRFSDVLEKSATARTLFQELGARFEEAQAILNQASALEGLRRYDQALLALAEARCLFEQEGNLVATADTDLRRAAVLLAQQQPAAALALAQNSAALFQERTLPTGEVRAHLLAARAALALNEIEPAEASVKQAVALAGRHDLPALTYQGHHLQGMLAARQGQPQAALAAYAQAIEAIERLYGRLMLEYRPDFAGDKGLVYEDAVLLCLEVDQPAQALAYAERAKSRALQELLSHRLNLRMEARSPADQPLVAELLQLRSERDRLYRRWETGERMAQRGHSDDLAAEQRQIEQTVLDLEKQITHLWHKLLVRNADYATDAALWQVRSEPIQPYLDDQTMLVEYFVAHDRLILFLVTADTCRAIHLPATVAQVQQLLQLFWLNLRSVPQSQPNRLAALTANAQAILRRLYGLLLEPVSADLAAYPRLIVVPHGPLHYLPFHALHDGRAYLLQNHEISYLPGASLLRFGRQGQPAAAGLLALGHSLDGRLPHAAAEAQAIATAWNGRALVEEAATLARFHEAAAEQRILHLATHGDFRPDNPLFSGLALADGWLTTLDIFNLRLSASLVTLSACQTGRHVIGGGDELMGLMRAFLAAGAASLLSTLWAVEDETTADLMHHFYHHLAAHSRKGEALRQAQCHFLTGPYAHPYFWAPFFLVGDPGPL